MRDRTYLDDVYDVFKEHTASIHKTLAEIWDLQEKIDSGLYGIDSQQEFYRQRDELKTGIKDRDIPAAMDAARAPFKREIKRLQALDAVNGADLSEDAKLLSSGIRLRKKDVDDLLAKPENNNPTMKRLISDYLEKHTVNDPDTGKRYKLHYTGHDTDVRQVEREMDALTHYYARWIADEKAYSMLDGFMPDQAAFARGEEVAE